MTDDDNDDNNENDNNNSKDKANERTQQVLRKNGESIKKVS